VFVSGERFTLLLTLYPLGEKPKPLIPGTAEFKQYWENIERLIIMGVL
jgi:hypothetical protein